MAFKGKLIGAGLGALVGGPVGAAIGAVLGGIADEESNSTPTSSEHKEPSRNVSMFDHDNDDDLMNDPYQIGGYYDNESGHYEMNNDRDDY